MLQWLDGLQDTDSEEEEPASSQEMPPILPETPEEEKLRLQIEEMRREDLLKSSRMSNPVDTPKRRFGTQ